MAEDLTLAIDVGTGSVRAGLLDRTGRILALAAREHDQIVPDFGWSEQRPADWWKGVAHSIRRVLDELPGARERVEAVAVCGQMHGTVLIDADGRLARETAPLWNDKRTVDHVSAFENVSDPAEYLPKTANPATPAWPAFKLQWLRDKDAQAYAKAVTVFMPKDWINFCLTGERAVDRPEAACSFLMDPATGEWSTEMCGRLGLEKAKLAPIREPLEILGRVHSAGAAETGLREGTPVLVGVGDFPAALLGSGVCRPGLASEIIGTSCIATLVAEEPLLDPEICNVGTVEGGWGAFMLLESGGDAMRWARRAFGEKALSYPDIVAKAAEAPAGSERLFFLPYLAGERLGAHRNARAQLFGLAAGHGLAHLHRAVLEGVAFAVARDLSRMGAIAGQKAERLVASGGGARTELWLKIKASATGTPILVPAEAECGLVGCAAMAGVATGRFSSAPDAAEALVRYEKEVLPEPRWAETYARMQPVWEKLYRHAQALYDDLDALA